MTDTPRHQGDLFETPAPPKSIPSNAEAPMMELLEALLTEALAGDNAEAPDVSKEADHDKDHA
jgi:hypothetical protein